MGNMYTVPTVHICMVPILLFTHSLNTLRIIKTAAHRGRAARRRGVEREWRQKKKKIDKQTIY